MGRGIEELIPVGAKLISSEEMNQRIEAVTREMVDHPSHYGGANNPHEHVKCAEAIGLDRDAHLYNCTKYIWRRDLKDDGLQDLKKALWYLKRAIELRERRAAEKK